jgi:hypothetical protein
MGQFLALSFQSIKDRGGSVTKFGLEARAVFEHAKADDKGH